MDGMYLTEEINGSISILLVLWMGCTLQRRLKVVFLYCWSYGWNVPYRVHPIHKTSSIEILPLISSVEYIPSIRPAV
jgi:hypothetical protein